jgi:hypothetical protein
MSSVRGPLGGFEQAMAISLASFSPSKILGTAGVARGFRLNTARCKMFTFVVAQPHNIFLYENFLHSHGRLRRSHRDESESSNPFKFIEAGH